MLRLSVVASVACPPRTRCSGGGAVSGCLRPPLRGGGRRGGGRGGFGKGMTASGWVGWAGGVGGGGGGSGQSAGRTRVFRHGHDDERLVAMAVRARAEWERLEEELGLRLLGREGVLVCGPNLPEREAAFLAAGVPARRLDRDGQAEALPVMAPAEDEALLDELGGSIDVRAAVDGLAAALGERVVFAQVFELD